MQPTSSSLGDWINSKGNSTVKACPECGLIDIIPGLDVIVAESTAEKHTLQVVLEEPEPKNHAFFWMPRSVRSGLRAEICGVCGNTQLYAKQPSELLQVHNEG